MAAVPKKMVTFLEDKHYLDENMFESNTSTLAKLHNWIPLSAGMSYRQLSGW